MDIISSNCRNPCFTADFQKDLLLPLPLRCNRDLAAQEKKLSFSKKRNCKAMLLLWRHYSLVPTVFDGIRPARQAESPMSPSECCLRSSKSILGFGIKSLR